MDKSKWSAVRSELTAPRYPLVTGVMMRPDVAAAKPAFSLMFVFEHATRDALDGRWLNTTEEEVCRGNNARISV